MTEKPVSARCPVCGYHVAVPFFFGGAQPLATLGWPSSEAEARGMEKLPLDFVQCPSCTHVYNRSFSYGSVPYQENPNLMFNNGRFWKNHLAEIKRILSQVLTSDPTVIEVGCGEGHFIHDLAESIPKGRFIGFDPNARNKADQSIEFYPRLFKPFEDIATFAPDVLIVRHVLEHVTELAGLLEPLAWSASQQGKPCYLFAEVPCIDRIFETGRLSDFYYEHVSHFTSGSFQTLLQRMGEVKTIGHGYGDEVIYGLVRLDIPETMKSVASQASAFCRSAGISLETISRQLSDLHLSGLSVAIWGGTGKSAAFMHHFGVDAGRFPLVVDSDPAKAGTYVPGTGQKIEFRDVLKEKPVDVIIIPCHWRLRDIIAEMKSEGIAAGKVLIEQDGHLLEPG
ncbi:MAG: methyltransferase domain-containing protein [Deltaproteobacteria bacterium]|nr:methyltransferase domain-containing protein [Deltaproteobacteria bacterium]